MIVEVKREHKQLGRRGTSSSCPLALAIKDKGYSFVNVTFLHAYIGNKLYSICKPGRQFILNFDAGKPVKLGKFRLTLIRENQ